MTSPLPPEGDSRTASGCNWELREGRYQDRLADVSPDLLVWDPPYSPRVHDGQRTGSETAKSTIAYDAISPEWCAEAVSFWKDRAKHWAITFSDHQGAQWWESAWQAAGWYVFAPVAWMRMNATPRVCGDGPTSAIDYITVARPKRRLAEGRNGSRPGYYQAQQSSSTVLVSGGKALDPMRALVRDYSIPGDVIADGCSGGGTTILAAAMEGRVGIGSEMDPGRFSLARKRLESAVITAPLFFDKPMKQEGLL